jgi:hypothetical protein
MGAVMFINIMEKMEKVESEVWLSAESYYLGDSRFGCPAARERII